MNAAITGRVSFLARGATGVVGAAAMVVGLLSAPAMAADSATVNVVHGIPGVAVNVCVDGARVADRFRYGQKIVGADLTARTHTVKLVGAGRACRAAAILKARYPLEAGRNYTIVANVDPSGSPKLTAFTNSVKRTRAGMARVSVRHTAQAPAVNVWAGSTKLIGGTSFTWGDRKRFAVPADSYSVRVTLPGSRKPVIGPAELSVRQGKAYQVYAVGTPGSYRLVTIGLHVGVIH